MFCFTKDVECYMMVLSYNLPHYIVIRRFQVTSLVGKGGGSALSEVHLHYLTEVMKKLQSTVVPIL